MGAICVTSRMFGFFSMRKSCRNLLGGTKAFAQLLKCRFKSHPTKSLGFKFLLWRGALGLLLNWAGVRMPNLGRMGEGCLYLESQTQLPEAGGGGDWLALYLFTAVLEGVLLFSANEIFKGELF